MISIVIPAYNAKKYIEKSINSVKKQTISDWELIIVNDDSVDSTGDIVQKFTLSDERIHLVNQKNGGVSRARNVGINKAKGEYITFLDADDMLLPNALQVMRDCIEEYNADICSARVCGDVDEKQTSATKFFSSDDCIELCIKDNPLVYACYAKLYRLDKIKEKEILFPIEKQVHEDSYFVFSCFYNDMNMVSIEYSVYVYNVTNGSLSRSGFSDKMFAVIELANDKYEKIVEKYPQYNKIASNILIKAYMVLLQNFLFTTSYAQNEKDSIEYICKNKKTFIPASRFDKKWHFIITHHLYWIYKFIKNKIK